MGNKSIQELRKELRQAETAFQRWDEVTTKREELENHILEMSSEVDRDSLASHQKASYDKEMAHVIAGKVESQKRLLQDLKNKKRELDTLLDTLEENSTGTINQLRAALINSILKEYPAEHTTYNTFKEEQKRQLALIGEIETVQNACRQVDQLLDVVLDERSAFKKRGILRYLLGRSPNTTLIQCLEAGRELSASAIKSIEDVQDQTLGGQSLKNLYLRLKDLFAEFHLLCSGRLNFKKIDTKFQGTSVSLKELLGELDQILQEAREAQRRVESKVEAWIDKF